MQFLNQPPKLELVPGSAQPKPNVRKTSTSTYGGMRGEEEQAPPISDLRLEDHVALRESAVGPSRHFAAPNNNVAIGVTTDVDRHGY
jgi:hypothetical protein